MSRSEMMPASAPPSPVTTSAPIIRSVRRATAAAMVVSGGTVATSPPLAFRIARTSMTGLLKMLLAGGGNIGLPATVSPAGGA